MLEYKDYRKILEFWEQGYNKKQIERMTYIPRSTIRDCINRFGSLKGLEENRERASRSTPDEVLAKIRNPENIAIQKAYAYLLGIYLGDGNLVIARKVYRLRVTLDKRYPGIIETCAKAIKVILPENEVGIVPREGCFDVSCYYKFWPDLFPQHGEGMKHTREIKLEDWQQIIADTYALEMFRGLFHSDGSRFRNIVKGKDYPRYQFTNNSDGIIKLFCRACDLLGVHWTEKHRNSPNGDRAGDIFISLRKDVEYLDSVVGPKR